MLVKDLTTVSMENVFSNVLNDAQDSIFIGCKSMFVGLTLQP